MRDEVRLFAEELGHGLVTGGSDIGQGRNSTYEVTIADGTRIFVKQLIGTDQQIEERMERMLLFGALAKNGLSGLRTPRLIATDRRAGLVAYEWIEDAETPGSVSPTDRSGWEHFPACAAVISGLHRLSSEGVVFPESPPTPMGVPFDFVPLSMYVTASSGELQALRILQRDTPVGQAVRALRSSSLSSPRCAVHGDLRLDQFMVVEDLMFLVDWEEFRLGDPAQDFGALIGELLYRVALRIFTGSAAATADLVSHGEHELDSARPVFVALWRSYGSERQRTDPDFVRRAIAYAGWHLFDRMLAVSQRSAEVTAPVRAVAGIGRAVLLNPESYFSVLGAPDEC